MRRARSLLLALFVLATITSMAGMEIFGWALFATSIPLFNRKFLTQPVLLAAYALVAWVGIGLWWNGDLSGFAEMRWVISLLGIALSIHAVIDENKIEKLYWPLIALATLIAVYSISQYWTGYDWLRGARSPLLLIEESKLTGELRYRPYGLFKMTLTYACSYAMFGMIPFCLSFLRKGRAFWLLQGAAGLIFLSVFMTFSRGVWISLAVALVILLWWLWRKALLYLPFAVVGIGAFAIAASPVLRERVLSFTDAKNESNSERMNLWRANWLMFQKHPIMGVGYERNGPPVLDEYYRELGITHEFRSHAHNNYLNFLSGTGLPGFLAYMSFILGALWLSVLNARALRRGPLFYLVVASIGAQVVLHVGGLTEYNFGDAEVQYQYLLYVALNLAVAGRRS